MPIQMLTTTKQSMSKEDQLPDRITIYYFSGTGNARNTALWISDETKKSSIDCDVIDIAKSQRRNIQPPGKNTFIGFIAPTHGFHFPKIMRQFIRHFPKSDNCAVFVVNTRAGLRIGKNVLGGINGILHYWSSIILKRKGYNVVGLYSVDLPSNWISIHPAVREKGVRFLYQWNEPKVREFAQLILSGNRSLSAINLRNILFDSVFSFVSVLYILVGRFFFSKSYIASSACNNCGLCEKKCPVQAIKTIHDRKFWTSKCESCMQCMNLCPKQAIETAHGFIVLICVFTSLLVGFVAHQLFKDIQWLQNRNILSLIESVLIVPIIIICYRIVHWLMRFKLFERIFVCTSLTKYSFWGRDKKWKS